MPVLKETVKSFMTQEQYGAAGESVLIIVDRDNVVIVESINGDRFPTLKTNITEEAVEVKPAEVVSAIPVRKIKTPKSKVTNNNTLF